MYMRRVDYPRHSLSMGVSLERRMEMNSCKEKIIRVLERIDSIFMSNLEGYFKDWYFDFIEVPRMLKKREKLCKDFVEGALRRHNGNEYVLIWDTSRIDGGYSLLERAEDILEMSENDTVHFTGRDGKVAAIYTPLTFNRLSSAYSLVFTLSGLWDPLDWKDKTKNWREMSW